MIKKHIALVVFTVAYAILLVHNIIPHHHHDNEQDLSEHHQTEHHHDGAENSSDDLSHLFSHFIHATDGFTFTAAHNLSNSFSKQLPVVSILPDNFLLAKFILPSLVEGFPSQNFIYISPHSLSSGLRAPPIFIG